MNQTNYLQSYIFDKQTGWRIDLPSYIAPGTRVLCLYRVSTGKQLYHNEQNQADVPMQRIRCRDFAERQGWTVICELQEEGVSGHKVRAEKRDKIQTIKSYALEHKFDILLVFMFDRIGRISDETPFVVEWFAQHDIRIWSAVEGEQKFESHVDKLTNYIRYWQADGESRKTAERVANSMAILTSEGCYTGGGLAYGYKYIRTGRTNKRKQEVNDLAIREDEAEVVRIMFTKARYEGYGSQRVANYLTKNGIKNREGKNWHPSTIKAILRNPLYIGIMRSGATRSPVQEHLRIIDDETFYVVQANLDARANMYANKPHTPVATCSNALLSGFIFCGHCGARLCVTTSGKGRPRKDGSDPTRTRYTCQTKSRTHGDCDGQTGYTVRKLDAMIDTILHGIFARIGSMRREDAIRACYSGNHDAQQAIFQKIKRDYEKAEQNLQTLKDEVVKSLTGESAFEPNILDMAIRGQEEKCAELRRAMAHAEEEAAKSQAAAEHIAKQYDEILEWAQLYDNCNISMKKVIVANMIDRVDVFRDYQLTIRLNITIEQFLISLENVA